MSWDLLESFDDSVESGDFSELTQAVHIRRSLEKVLDGENRDKVDTKPRLQIPAHYNSAGIDDFFDLIVMS